MVVYGGTDTQSLAGADIQGRQQKLKAQMDYAQQVNQGLQQSNQSVQGGLQRGEDIINQKSEAEKNRKLEAARSGLELDTSSGKYIESQPAQQKRQFEQGRQVAEYGLEKDYKTSQILQKQQELGIEQQKANIEGQRVQGETGLRQQHSAVEMAKTNIEAAREERLMQEFNTKTGIERETARDALNDKTNKLLEDNTSNMVKLQLGDLSATKDAVSMLAIPAQNNPKLQQALQGLLSGKSTPDGMQQIMSSLQEQRNAIAISGAAKTGYMSPLVDPQSPTMQDFYSFRNLYTRRMEGDMSAELEIMKQLPEGEREGFKQYLRLSSMSQEDRVSLATKAAAQGYQGITMARRAMGASSGGQQQSGGPAGSGQTKLGGASQPSGGTTYGGAGSNLSLNPNLINRNGPTQR